VKEKKSSAELFVECPFLPSNYVTNIERVGV
jgi:hypothetical protein